MELLLQTKIPDQLGGEWSLWRGATLLLCTLAPFLGGWKALLPGGTAVCSPGKNSQLCIWKEINAPPPGLMGINKKALSHHCSLILAETQTASPFQLLQTPNFRSEVRRARSAHVCSCIFSSSPGSTMTHFKSWLSHNLPLLVNSAFTGITRRWPSASGEPLCHIPWTVLELPAPVEWWSQPKIDGSQKTNTCTLFLEMWNKGRHSRTVTVSILLWLINAICWTPFLYDPFPTRHSRLGKKAMAS